MKTNVLKREMGVLSLSRSPLFRRRVGLNTDISYVGEAFRREMVTGIGAQMGCLLALAC